MKHTLDQRKAGYAGDQEHKKAVQEQKEVLKEEAEMEIDNDP
jgi:hypothetical protein